MTEAHGLQTTGLQANGLQSGGKELGLSVARGIPGVGQIELHTEWPLLARIPFRLTAGILLPHFKVRNLVQLAVGAVLETDWEGTADVPLKCGDVQICWAEFEVVEQRLAVRITRLA